MLYLRRRGRSLTKGVQDTQAENEAEISAADFLQGIFPRSWPPSYTQEKAEKNAFSPPQPVANLGKSP